ncbi:flagellar hook-length control protein FliK [Motiliproteus sp. SC1-56]|uniref:flagellar hook-length control protein FliK n=1 Tax=Motiliproteus sp. SC1-56 TaxID=2799565 RepID=UPI001A8FE416
MTAGTEGDGRPAASTGAKPPANGPAKPQGGSRDAETVEARPESAADRTALQQGEDGGEMAASSGSAPTDSNAQAQAGTGAEAGAESVQEEAADAAADELLEEALSADEGDSETPGGEEAGAGESEAASGRDEDGGGVTAEFVPGVVEPEQDGRAPASDSVGADSVAAEAEGKPGAETVASVVAADEKGGERARQVAAEPAAVHNPRPGPEQAAADGVARGGVSGAEAARTGAQGGGQEIGRQAEQLARARAGGEEKGDESAEAEGERRRERDFYRAGREGLEPGRQNIATNKGQFTAEFAKELTFDNPFRNLGAVNLSSRAEGPAGQPPASLAQLQQAYQGSATGATPSLALGERFGSQTWSSGLGQRVLWMANQQVGRAELRLDPPELGSLTVKLSISQEQASVSFTSPHAHVREALEQQLPRLREMLAESGLNLEQADVSDQSLSRESGDEAEDGRGAGRGRGGEEMADAEGRVGQDVPMRASLALVDYYA